MSPPLRDKQLLPRNLDTNLGTINISGRVNTAGYDQILLRTHRQGVLHGPDVSQILNYTGNIANFSLVTTIPAELANYDEWVIVKKGMIETEVFHAEDVVAGDSIIVLGQSNAVAARTTKSSSAGKNKGPFLRTFGLRGSLTNVNWFEADADADVSGQNSIGQWAVRMGRVIIDKTGIPLCIINNGQGSSPSWQFLPGKGFYQVTRKRAKLAGVQAHVRAFMWHQVYHDVLGNSGDASDVDSAARNVNNVRQIVTGVVDDYAGIRKCKWS